MIGNLTNTPQKRFPAPSFVSLGNDEIHLMLCVSRHRSTDTKKAAQRQPFNQSVSQSNKAIRLNREWVLNRFVAFVAFNPEVIHRHPCFQIF